MENRVLCFKVVLVLNEKEEQICTFIIQKLLLSVLSLFLLL